MIYSYKPSQAQPHVVIPQTPQSKISPERDITRKWRWESPFSSKLIKQEESNNTSRALVYSYFDILDDIKELEMLAGRQIKVGDTIDWYYHLKAWSQSRCWCRRCHGWSRGSSDPCIWRQRLFWAMQFTRARFTAQRSPFVVGISFLWTTSMGDE